MTNGMSEKKRSEFLLATLLDEDESLEMRYSAITYLGNLDHPHALKSLISFACRENEQKPLLRACGNAIARIWDRNKSFDLPCIIKMVSEPTRQAINNWLNSK